MIIFVAILTPRCHYFFAFHAFCDDMRFRYFERLFRAIIFYHFRFRFRHAIDYFASHAFIISLFRRHCHAMLMLSIFSSPPRR
jgi:hypothetical protein